MRRSPAPRRGSSWTHAGGSASPRVPTTACDASRGRSPIWTDAAGSRSVTSPRRSNTGALRLTRRPERRSVRGFMSRSAAIVLCGLLAATAAAGARPRALALRRVTPDLPGPPSVIVPADLDHDGRKDLLVVVAYTRWGSITTDRVEQAIEVTEVVPALFDVREARAFLAQSGGGYRALPAPLPL